MSTSLTSAVSPSSSLRKSTPARAIMSPLSTRSAPPIPPSTDLFEPLVKSVLRHRLLYNIFGYSLLFSWIQTAFWAIWSVGYVGDRGIAGTLATLVWPTTLFFAFLRWAVVSLPVIILRKQYLTVTRTAASSPSILLRNALSSKSILPVLVTYTVSAFFIALLHSSSPRLSIFIRSNNAYHLNGRFLFLLTTQVTAFYGHHLRNILIERFVFPWSKLSDSVRRWPFRSSDLFDTFLITTLFTCICSLFSMIAFALSRFILSLLIRVPLLAPILVPLTGHFLQGPWTIFLPFLHIPLLFKSFSLSLMTLSAMEFADMLFDDSISQPVLIAHNTSNRPLTIVSGMTSSNMFIKHLAYSDLFQLAADQSTRGVTDRTALFGDSKHIPSLWSQLVRDALILLGHDYQILLRRGRELTPSSQPPPPSGASSNLQIPGTPTHLIKKSIYKPTPSSPLRAAGDSLAAEAGAGAVRACNLLRSLQAAILQKSASIWSVSSLRKQVGDIMGQVIVRYIPLWAREAIRDSTYWWRRERVHKIVEACLPRTAIDKLAIRALSRLVCASLVEDQYGVVQRDIPQILEALLSFLAALEQYQIEISARYTPQSKDALEEEYMQLELAKAQEILNDMKGVSKEAVARIVGTFGSKLLAFKFPIRTADRLQTFLDNS